VRGDVPKVGQSQKRRRVKTRSTKKIYRELFEVVYKGEKVMNQI